MDSHRRITDLNRAAERITGYKREEALGYFCGEILQSSLCARECPLQMAMTHGEVISKEAVLTSRSGQKLEVMLSAAALWDDQGTMLGGVEVFRDIGPYKRMERERRHLVSMFAHDLKTPVVAVGGLLNRLTQGKWGPLDEAQKQPLEIISKEIQRLERLIKDFLEFARLDLHILTPLPSAMQLDKECQEIFTLLEPMAEAKDIDLRMEFPPEIVILYADPLLFRRVLENILGNALKYSPAHSAVTLAVRVEGTEVRFAVTDQGPGISAMDLPHLFEAFYRGAGANQERGFGLGLATVKRIIDAHGGRIWVESAPGQGTTFHFTLPWERQEQAAAR